MTVAVTFHTIVFKVPASPLGLLPENWAIRHRCTTCQQHIPTDQLLAHSQTHDIVQPEGDTID